MCSLVPAGGLFDHGCLRAWKPGQRAEWLRGLPAEVKARLPWLWEFWARPEQIWRPGTELITLIQAGRGWGKTRVGGQATRWVAEHPEACGFGKPPLREGAKLTVDIVSVGTMDGSDPGRDLTVTVRL